MTELDDAKVKKSDTIKAVEESEKLKDLPELYSENDELKRKGLSAHDFSSISSNVVHKPKGFRMGFGDRPVR